MSQTVRSSRRRVTIAMVVVLALVLVFVVRLVDIQVVHANELSLQANDARSISTTTYGDRGEITDRNGTVLAGTVLRYNITAAPKYAVDHKVTAKDGTVSTETVKDDMAKVAAATGGDVDTMMAALEANKTADFAYLVKGVDVTAYRAVVKLGISYVYTERQTARTYPNGAVAGNLTGFVGTDGAQAGLELEYDKCLAGQNGSQTYERGADGVKLPGSTVTTTKAVAGGTLKTTLDENLQFLVQQDLATEAQKLGAVSATAVVMKSGDASLLAVADYPSVDPNDVSATNVANLGSKAFTDLYEPGSTFKGMTAASLIDAGLASPSTQATVPDRRVFSFGGSVSDAETHPVEHLTLAGVLADSSNVGITLLGDRMTPQKRYEYMLKFGLGRKTEVNFPGEPTAALKPASQWDAQTDENSMFGQGVAATAIQTASIYQTIANGGVREPVKLVESCTTSDGKVIDKPSTTGTRVVSKTAADDVVKMLENTIPEGTLKGLTPISGYNISAKTGTAQVADAPNGGYGSDYIVSVAGIAPSENPQYVVLVTFTKPTTLKTSFAAGPAFREIMSQVLENYRVTPSTTPAANIPDTW